MRNDRTFALPAALATLSGCATRQKFAISGTAHRGLTAHEFGTEYVREANALLEATLAHDDAAAVVAPAALVRAVAPCLPATYQADASGRTWACVVVDETGAVTRIEFLGETDPRLRNAVAVALSQWRFEPATVAGTRVRSAVIVPFAFEKLAPALDRCAEWRRPELPATMASRAAE